MSVQVLTAKLGTLNSLVTIESALECTIIKPREYIRNKDQWNAINKLLRQEGGKWVGVEGAIGHWEVPLIKPLQFTQAEIDAHGRVQRALELVKEAERLLTEELK